MTITITPRGIDRAFRDLSRVSRLEAFFEQRFPLPGVVDLFGWEHFLKTERCWARERALLRLHADNPNASANKLFALTGRMSRSHVERILRHARAKKNGVCRTCGQLLPAEIAKAKEAAR